MTEMVKRVARAICQQDEQNGGAPWDWYDAKGHDRYLELARAALAAVREPPDGVLAQIANDHWSGPREAVTEVGEDYVRGFNAACAAHRSMIDAALAEGEKG